MSALNSFDRIAPVYDRLAHIVFGSAIDNAQRAHLDQLLDAREILIVGGGTGWLLKELLGLNPSATVTYVEASREMIDLTEKRIPETDRHRVVLVHGTHDSLEKSAKFDAIVINFFVDMFSSTELIIIIKQLKTVLHADGLLLCTDFVNDTFWQRAMLRVMYSFFRLTAGLNNQHLADWRKIIRGEGFDPQRAQSYWKGFMWSELYRRIS